MSSKLCVSHLKKKLPERRAQKKMTIYTKKAESWLVGVTDQCECVFGTQSISYTRIIFLSSEGWFRRFNKSAFKKR